MNHFDEESSEQPEPSDNNRLPDNSKPGDQWYQREKYPPELIAWANSLYTDEEILAAIDEMQRNGGKELKDFIHEIEAILDADD